MDGSSPVKGASLSEKGQSNAKKFLPLSSFHFITKLLHHEAIFNDYDHWFIHHFIY